MRRIVSKLRGPNSIEQSEEETESQQTQLTNNSNNNQTGLTQFDLDKLASSWISPELASIAKLFRVDSQEGAQIVGRSKSSGDYSGIIFPNIFPGQTKAREYRLRRDHPELEYKEGQPRERNKYLSPPGRSNLLYFVPGTAPEDLADTNVPIVVTEGEKKALALHRLSLETEQSFLVIGLAGVWGWRGVIGKETAVDGSRTPVKGVIGDFDHIAWDNRAVYIVFDSNVHTNTSVATARRQLAQELCNREAKTFYVDIPVEAGVNGVDDLLALWGAQRVLELFEQATPLIAMLAEQAINLTDLGNARRLVKLHGYDLHYCHAWNKWLVWDGKRWKIDATAEVMRKAKRTVASIYAEAAEASEEEHRKATADHAKRSESERSLKAMVSLAQSEPAIPVIPEQLDKDPFLLNALNGTLDLRDSKLLPHSKDALLTKLIPVAYDQKAQCPNWLAFLDKIMAGNQNMINFLQRSVGYALTGDTSERVLFILHGCGANGKTTFLEVISTLLGDYAMRTPTETIMIKRDGGIPNDVARLRGSRFVYASETEDGKRLAEALVKDMTGGDKISARFLRAEWFEFLPEFKLWLGTNHKPHIRGTDNAIWDRIRLIPFDVKIPPSERIPRRELIDKLCTELPGILKWALEGYQQWRESGLGMPVEVHSATEHYRNEMDILGIFIKDHCVINTKASIKKSQLYAAYKKWCDDNNENSLTQHRFSQRLTERGFESARSGHDWSHVWNGIGLLAIQE